MSNSGVSPEGSSGRRSPLDSEIQSRAYLVNRRNAQDDPIHKEVDVVLSVMSLIRFGSMLVCLAVLQLKQNILVRLLSYVSCLWNRVGQPHLKLAFLPFIVSLLCLAQMVFGIVVTVFASTRIPLMLPIDPIILYAISPIQGYLYELISVAPAVIFVFMSLAYATLADSLDIVLCELPSPGLPVQVAMEIFDDTRASLVYIAHLASVGGFASVLATGSMAMMTIFFTVIPNNDFYLSLNYIEYSGTGLLFVAVTVALYLGHLVELKLLEAKDLVDSSQMAHLQERDLRVLHRSLKRIRYPPKAGGVFQLDLRVLLSLYGFLLSYTMVFIQFKAIMATSNTSNLLNNSSSVLS